MDALFGERPEALGTLGSNLLTAPTALLEPATVPLAITDPDPQPMAELEIESEPAQVTLERRRMELDALSRQDPKRTAELLRTLIDDRQPA
jgi:flagellar M-ring protein FliF